MRATLNSGFCTFASCECGRQVDRLGLDRKNRGRRDGGRGDRIGRRACLCRVRQGLRVGLCAGLGRGVRLLRQHGWLRQPEARDDDPASARPELPDCMHVGLLGIALTYRERADMPAPSVIDRHPDRANLTVCSDAAGGVDTTNGCVTIKLKGFLVFR